MERDEIKEMKTRKYVILLVVGLLFLSLLAPLKVAAADRKATISAPAEAQKDQTFTVTLGFSPKADTRSCNFTLQYDNQLLKYVAGSASNVSGMSGEISIGDNSPLSMVLLTLSSASADKIISLKFKVLKEGSATIKVTAASDGEQANTVSAGASRTIKLVAPAPTTTTTTAPKTTTTKTTGPTTTTASTTPTTTLPDPDRHPSQALIGKRYDGLSLFVPETIPSEAILPEGFQALDIMWKDKNLTGYESETLPYQLFWLIDEEGETRLYRYDEDLAFFIPYLRVEWSSRFYTLSLLPEEELPQGFDMTTVRIWNEEVPAYRPSEDHYLSKAVYDAFLAQEDQEGEGDLPQDIYLLALHMNDSEKKGLYLYDRGIDSLIRAELWLVPLAGSILDPDQAPPVTEPSQSLPSQPEETEPLETEPLVAGSVISLFGYQMPLYVLLGAIAAILLLAALILWLVLRARKAASYEPELTLADLDGEPGEELPDPAAEEVPVLEDMAETPEPEIEGDQDLSLVESQEEVLVEEAVFEEIPPSKDPEDGWAALSQTLLEVEKKKEEENRSKHRPPGIRPLTHRRVERDDPEDTQEL